MSILDFKIVLTNNDEGFTTQVVGNELAVKAGLLTLTKELSERKGEKHSEFLKKLYVIALSVEQEEEAGLSIDEILQSSINRLHGVHNEKYDSKEEDDVDCDENCAECEVYENMPPQIKQLFDSLFGCGGMDS